MAIHLPIGPLKTCSGLEPGWSRYRDVNPVPTSSLADDITTALSGPVKTWYIGFGLGDTR